VRARAHTRNSKRLEYLTLAIHGENTHFALKKQNHQFNYGGNSVILQGSIGHYQIHWGQLSTFTFIMHNKITILPLDSKNFKVIVHRHFCIFHLAQ
jgi:hypothetical protein